MNNSTRLLAASALIMACVSPAFGNGIRVQTLRTEIKPGTSSIEIDARVSWRNAWHNTRNHDAAWLVVKLRGNPQRTWAHAKLLRVSVAGSPQATCTPSADGLGAFCSVSQAFRGDVDWTVKLEVSAAGMPEADVAARTVEALVFGVEMVHIPAGPFTIGDSDARSVESNAFYKSDAQGNHAGTYRITSEAAIPVGPQAGSLYYKGSQYAGDRNGPVPDAFPKGTRAFYVMKYEILQGQYADFLNTLYSQSTSFRSPTGGRHYATERGSIRIENGNYVAGSPDRPANQLSWDDGAAFADWFALRPWTELEFSKAARGPVDPIANDFPWGTDNKDRLLRRVAADDDLVQSGEADESRLTDATRDVFGASYYWVMDLAGSVWEKVVTIGHPKGRAFTGTHGDGRLTEYGLATNADWPTGDFEGGGYGYRGGGYYARGSADGPLNPHSRVEQRPYGSWGGGPRGIAYGFRAARTAD